MKLSKEMKTDIKTEMQRRNFKHSQSNGIDQYINGATRDGIELKGGKIDGFVIDQDLNKIYGLDKIGNEARDAIKWLSSYLFPEPIHEHARNLEVPAEGLTEVLEVVPQYLSTEQVDRHPGTIAALISLQKTDPKYVLERPGARGAILKYVDTGYVTVALNWAALMDWDFEILESDTEKIEDKMHVSVLGCLTIRTTEGKTIQKTQWGSQVLKQGMELGDARKAAASDAMKKCASMLGIAADVYAGAV